MFPGFGGVSLLDSGVLRVGLSWWILSYSIGVRIPRLEWRRCRLWKISRYSKMALASSILVRHRCRFHNSTCIRAQNDSTTALSKQSPTDPIEGTRPDLRARWVNAHEVYCPGSRSRRNTALLMGA